jgi:tuberculosinol/isotuberculosinol synthase
MNLDSFLALSDTDTADIVRRDGPRVVVFPINGTRRWFLLEHGNGAQDAGESDAGFLDLILDRYIALFQLIFDHGISTVLSPVLGPDIAARESAYQRMVHAALEEITGSGRFAGFYARCDVRVRFYGDFDPYLETNAPEIPERIRRIQESTGDRIRHKLFWGMFAHDPVETIGRLAIRHNEETGRHPQRNDLVTRYYGEFIPPADIFIGMMPPRVYDFPLLDTGRTALFFTTAPSPYLDREMLRRILFEYLYNGPEDEAYESDHPDDWDELAAFYRNHRRDLTGTGRLVADGRVWLPD